MPKGASGRVVVEAGADLKRRLYGVLEREGLTLKDWFVRAAEDHIDEHQQPRLLPTEKTVSKDSRKP